MDKNKLKDIILEQNETLLHKKLGVRRDIFDKIKTSIKLPKAIVISGIRRVGKSTLLLQILNDHKKGYYYFNFEDERLLNFSLDNFNDLYELFIELYGKKTLFVFDEIQNVTGWENFVRRMQDSGNKFLLTGSNASMLSKELGTKLTGRNIRFDLFPFSFGEYLNFVNYDYSASQLNTTAGRAKIKNKFNKYLLDGGMPEFLTYGERDILTRTYEDILYRDIAARYDIGEIRALRELTLYYLSNVGNLVSFNKIKEMLKLGSVNTVSSYTEYLETSYLIFTVNVFSYSVAKQLIAPKKIYAIDTGLINNIAFKFSENRGKLLENLVYLELRRKKSEVFYYKTKNNKEVDFAVKSGNAISQLLQVCDNLHDEDTKKREIDALVESMDEVNLKKSTILTYDEKDEITIAGRTIEIIPIYEWLLK